MAAQIEAHFVNAALIVTGLIVLVWPKLVMGWHEIGWSHLYGKEPARRLSHTVFMPPHFALPRAIALFFIALGVWPYFAAALVNSQGA